MVNMAKNRVLSFMTNFSNRDPNKSKTPSPSGDTIPFPTFPEKPQQQHQQQQQQPQQHAQNGYRSSTPERGPQLPSNIRESPTRREQVQRNRANSRPISMVQTYQPPLMALDQDTLPELQPVFAYLNSHGNKLYQEGYFLKLDDQNSQGKPNADRTWTECFGQLVGTILSLWDAVELDAAGSEGEVLPKFINLTDASIKMIESLPTRTNDDQPLQNVLSISTAGKNRYLLHFNSHHSLVQWTAGIRLAIFEYTTLQEAYTGALIAGKGKSLNNIKMILARSIFKYEDWVRVRFGAGTPWRQCWCVITPPDEKELHKLQKEFNKKKSVYDRARPPVLKGDIKFYESRKVTKKSRPIASISDAFSAFAIYPQSKALIDPSTLVKVEGTITIHSDPPTTTEGFVFVMPEVHAAVSGFEIMLRWLFPVFDTFALYGRPERLIADTLDTRSLMFAMPNERRYGYLDVLDVAALISSDGSQNWSEGEWRRRLKDATAKRMIAINANGGSRRGSRRNTLRDSFNDKASIRSTPSISWGPPPVDVPGPRTDSAPPISGSSAPYPPPQQQQHMRSASDGFHERDYPAFEGSNVAPPPPLHRNYIDSSLRNEYDNATKPSEPYADGELRINTTHPAQEIRDLQLSPGVAPVSRPPAFSHAPGSLPPSGKLQNSPELRRAKSRMSNGTLSQFAGAGGVAAHEGVAQYRAGLEEARRAAGEGGPQVPRGVHTTEDPDAGMNANLDSGGEGVVAGSSSGRRRLSLELAPALSSMDGTSEGAGRHVQQEFSNNDSNRYPNSDYLNRSSFDAPAPVPQHRNVVRPTVIVPQQQQQQQQHEPHSYVKGHAYTSSVESTSSQPRSANRNSLPRKPLPPPTPVDSGEHREPMSAKAVIHHDAISPGTESTIGSLRMDQDAFDSIQSPDSRQFDSVQRQTTNLSHVSENSNYTNSSSATASEREPPVDQSVPARTAYDRPRSGMMRTVGGFENSATTPTSAVSDIPVVDFGPTINYVASKPPSRPLPPSPSPIQTSPPQHTQRTRTPDPNRPTQTQAYTSQQPRSVPWAPGMASSVPSSPVGMTPEQFVAARAAAAAATGGAQTSPYTHARQSSSATLRANTPPATQQRRPDYIKHTRNNSSFDALQREAMYNKPPSRPSSRGAGATLGGAVDGGLSAREQEAISRATGAPLVALPAGAGRGAAQVPGGLVGTIDSRGGERRGVVGEANRAAGAYAQGWGGYGYPQQQQQRAQSPGPMGAYGQPQQQARGQSPGPMGGYRQPQVHQQQRAQSPGPMGAYGQPQVHQQQRAQSPGPMGAYGQPQQGGQSPGRMAYRQPQLQPQQQQQQLRGKSQSPRPPPGSYQEQQQQFYQMQMGRGRGTYRG